MNRFGLNGPGTGPGGGVDNPPYVASRLKKSTDIPLPLPSLSLQGLFYGERHLYLNVVEPSAPERPVRGFIPPLILSLFGYCLRIGHRGESERHGCSRTRFPVRNRILSVTG